jgi:FKBP-type peptidyl-prolyl cis-trans isomerase
MKKISYLLLIVLTLASFACSNQGKDSQTNEKGLITMENGLKYTIDVEGDGLAAKKGDKVLVHYTGWLMDGTKFDSSKDRDQAFTFQLGAGRVIKGWDQGVLGMKVGEVRTLLIPAELGYGSRGAGRVIPPNADLKFQVELLEIM